MARRLVAVLFALICGFWVAAALWLTAGPAAAARPSPSGGCQPTVTKYSEFRASATAGLVIDGSCFGPPGSFTNTDAPFFRVTDFGPKATAAEVAIVMAHDVVPKGPGAKALGDNRAAMPGLSWWNACNDNGDTLNGAPDEITCTVTWSDTMVKLSAVNLGGYSLTPGDMLAVQLWDSQTLYGPPCFTPGPVCRAQRWTEPRAVPLARPAPSAPHFPRRATLLPTCALTPSTPP